MDQNSGDWETACQKDSSGDYQFEKWVGEDKREWDPLAQLAAELAISEMAVEEGRGAFCRNCTCQLQYHVLCDKDGGCELCICEELDSVQVPNVVGDYCSFNPKEGRGAGVYGEYVNLKIGPEDWGSNSNRSRYKAAREVLRELSE